MGNWGGGGGWGGHLLDVVIPHLLRDLDLHRLRDAPCDRHDPDLGHSYVRHLLSQASFSSFLCLCLFLLLCGAETVGRRIAGAVPGWCN